VAQIPFDERGILLRRNAVRLGFDDNWLSRMVRSEALLRVRQGAYVDPVVWTRASRSERHQLTAAAAMQQYDDRVALSHTSAHLARGGPDYGLDLSTVHLTNMFGRGDRTQAGITHHHGLVTVRDVSRMNGHWITAGGRTAVETAALAALVPAVCMLDWTLQQGWTSPAELAAYVETYMREWPGTIGLPVALARCDGRSESVGESRSRLLLEDLGFRCEPQWTVPRPSGGVAGRVDLLLPDEGVMVEFDGKIKYGRLLKPGQTIGDVIEAERQREVLLQEVTTLPMLRLVWRDLDDPGRIGERVRRLAASSTGRRRTG
jgi:hypothetical protein